MQRTLEYTITGIHDGVTIERFLRESGYSHHIITHLKKTQDGITCNGVWAYANHILQEHDLLVINITENVSSENIVPIKMPLDIIYEDKDIMVLNKPADMPIHPSQNNYDNTLANGVAYYFVEQNTPYTYRCINRLDRDTTGLLILAKHMLSAAILSQMMKERQISRTYLALVEGSLSNDNGTINAPIGRKNGSTIERIIDEAHGETAITHYKVLQNVTINTSTTSPMDISLVELNLETGRTHQIRVHMKSIGHPLVGDTLYNPTSTLLNRQALHSYSLTFSHPTTKKVMTFTCPLPNDFSLLCNQHNCCNP